MQIYILPSNNECTFKVSTSYPLDHIPDKITLKWARLTDSRSRKTITWNYINMAAGSLPNLQMLLYQGSPSLVHRRTRWRRIPNHRPVFTYHKRWKRTTVLRRYNFSLILLSHRLNLYPEMSTQHGKLTRVILLFGASAKK
jgi:hypothetical protein